MINNLKALVVVMVIAVIVFTIARPLCLRFMAEADFVRRRNIWFALTITAFVSPSFWMFAAVALPLVAWGAHKDPNPLALYVLVYCIIPISIKVEIPIGGINALFGMGQQRILAFAILIPVAWRLLFPKERKGTGRLTMVDLFVLAYIGLSAVQLWPVSETTQFMRWGFLKFLDVILLYYVALRACGTRKAIVEVMAIYCLLCAVVAPLALFESQRHWLLYTELGKIWGDPVDFAYVSRAGNLRAQVTAGQSIPLGYVLAFGFGIWLYLSSHVNSRFWTIAYGVLMWAGMFAAGARAPWIAAVAIFFTFLILGPNATARFWKASLVSVLFAGAMLLSPLGGRIIDRLPFIGKVEQENVVYRQQLAAVSWEVVKQYPFFGDMYFERHLQSLRQGEGIIDLVNTYAQISMSRGLIGLFLYLAPYLIALSTAFRLSRRAARLDPDLSLLGAVLFACLFGSLLAMGMGGFGPAPDTFAIVVIGLSVTCSRLGIGKEATQVRPPRQTRAQPQWTMKRG
jgi:O-Antigen ligase